MVPIVAGLGTAVLFATSALVSARASRIVGSPSTVGGAMLTGLAIGLPIALLTAPRPDLRGEVLLWVVFAGFGNVFGLLLTYAAYRIGAVGIIATIDSTEGAIAATLAVLTGEAVLPGVGPILVLIAIGVVLAAAGGGSEEGVAISRDRAIRAALLATGAAICFGLSLFGSGRAAGAMPIAWAMLPPRIVGVVFVALPLLVLGRFRMTRSALPFVIATGVAEVIGFSLFAIGARETIAVTSVLASMFAPISAVGAYIFFRERLSGRQLVGIAFIVSGVVGLGILQA